jgi:hypothetical protein
MCGTAEWEWKENRFAYEPMDKICMGCYYKEVTQTGQDRPGVSTVLVPSASITDEMRENAVAEVEGAWDERNGW